MRRSGIIPERTGNGAYARHTCTPDRDARARSIALTGVVALAATMFAVDRLLDPGAAMGFGYLAVVFAAALLASTGWVILTTIACSVMLLTGWPAPPVDGVLAPGDVAATNRLLALIAMWAVAAVVLAEHRADARLRMRDAVWREIYDAGPELLLCVDRHGVVVAVNRFGADLLGFAREDLVGRDFSSLIAPQDRAAVLELDATARGAARDRSPREIEFRLLRRDGRVLWASGTRLAQSFRRAGGADFCLSCRDLSDRKRVETELATSEQCLERAHSLARVGTWTWNVARDEVWWSPETYRIFGIEPCALAADFERVRSMVHPADRSEWAARVNACRADGTEYDHEFRIVTAAGDVRIVRSWGTATRGVDGAIEMLAGTVIDRTEDVLARRELDHLRADRRRLLLRNLDAHDHTRAAIARDLHDEFGQLVIAVRHLAERLEMAIADGRHDTVQGLAGDIRATCTRMATSINSVVESLHPVLVDALGLSAALRTLAEEYRRLNPGVTIDASVAEVIDDAMPQHLRVGIYRIAQEALVNALRHSGARRISVRLAVEREGQDPPHGLELAVDDDGRGPPDDAALVGHGIRGMRDRAEALAGSLEIGASPAGGLRVRARLPLTPAPREA